MDEFHTNFRAGFVAGMRAIGNDDAHVRWREIVRGNLIDGRVAGFRAAIEHFEGHANERTDIADDLGLIAAYAAFYGQGDFNHPSVP